MKMPSAKKERWLKALRSGGYDQANGTLYDPATQSFCCLGVMQHCLSRGKVEVDSKYSASFEGLPTSKWCKRQGIELEHMDIEYPIDPLMDKLIAMNDGGRSFAEIANVIEKE